MEEILFKSHENKEKFNYFIKKYKNRLRNDDYNLIKIVIVNFKRYVKDEDKIIFAFIYGIEFFVGLDKDEEKLTENEKKDIRKLRIALKYELDGDMKNLIKSIYNLEDDIFMLKIIIKYTIISFSEKYIQLISNTENYYKSLGYIIPLLTLRNNPFLRFFQDTYFEKIYNKEYKNTKKRYLNEVNKIPFPGEHMVMIVNNLNKVMEEARVLGRIEIRKKSYFSLFNKIERKGLDTITDNIGVRLIFKNKEELYNFIEYFEARYIFTKKKNYMISPKKNGYKSVHYSFLSPYRDVEVLVELQLRTCNINNKIESSEISHYNYTIGKNKWSDKFKEVTKGYKILQNILEEGK